MKDSHADGIGGSNVAVVGTGIAGMAAAWLLSRRHRVTVFERAGRTGGHSNTVRVRTGEGWTPVDTGFIVYNECNYPNLTALLAHLGVATHASDMSFAASLDDGRLEYSGTGLNGLLGQRGNLVNPRFVRMVADILRFYREAPRFLDDGRVSDIGIGDYLREGGFGEAFVEDHLLPMGAAIWSVPTAEMRAHPAETFLRFFRSHGLLALADRPRWRTVTGGSREYVRRLTAPYVDRIRYGGVSSVLRDGDEVVLREHRGDVARFDHVVLATHADEALGLLGDADARERSVLGSWRYAANRAVLHRDPSLMPRRRRVWSSWNVLGHRHDGGADRSLCVTYWMNRLQGIAPDDPLFVTLNPIREPHPDLVVDSFDYSHPIFDRAASASRPGLWALQGHRRTWYCGSYFGYGFHEDALQSGLAVAERLGGLSRPWTVSGGNDRLPGFEDTAAAAA